MYSRMSIFLVQTIKIMGNKNAIFLFLLIYSWSTQCPDITLFINLTSLGCITCLATKHVRAGPECTWHGELKRSNSCPPWGLLCSALMQSIKKCISNCAMWCKNSALTVFVLHFSFTLPSQCVVEFGCALGFLMGWRPLVDAPTGRCSGAGTYLLVLKGARKDYTNPIKTLC